MKPIKLYRIALGCLICMAGVTSCQQDDAPLSVGSARIETKALDGEGQSVALSEGLHLYGVTSSGVITTYTADFKSGSYVSIADLTGGYMTMAGTTGTGELSFPTADSEDKTIQIVTGKAIPTLFLGTSAKIAGTESLLPITMQCRTARLSFKVTQEMIVSSITLNLKDMFSAIRLDGTVAIKKDYPITLTKESDKAPFTAELNCFPAPGDIAYTITATDGAVTKSEFSIPAIEAGKNYQIDLTVSDNRIYVGNVTITAWDEQDAIEKETE